MKVTFKLTAEQAARAKAVAERVQQRRFESSGYDTRWEDQIFDQGNLLGDGFKMNMNLDQALNLAEDGFIVTYSGQRCPLHQDGGMAAILEIAAGDLESLEVAEYVTSDPCLKWHETKEDWAIAQLKAGVVTPALALEWARTGQLWGLYLSKQYCEGLKGPSEMPKPGTAEYLRASAEGTLEAIKEKALIVEVLDSFGIRT